MILFGLAVMMMNTQLILSETYDNQYYCPDFHPQMTLDLDQVMNHLADKTTNVKITWKNLMGVWYIIEIINHKREEGMIHGAVTLRACPTIHIGRESRSDLRLVWNEPSATLYYKIRLENPNSPGSWVSSGPHNETSTPGTFYTHFTGTIQVMKAVGNHMVLTFCTTRNERSLFSVLLGRERQLSRLEIRGVNNMLQRRGLEPILTKYTCSKSSILKPILLQILFLVAWRCFF